MNKIQLFFSFRSPFAAIAVYRMRRLRSLADVEVELMPVWPEVIFGGHMDNPSDSLFKMAYLFNDAARQAELAGLSSTYLRTIGARFQLPETGDYRSAKVGVPAAGPTPNWAQLHLAQLYANAQGCGWAFADLVCQRRFAFDGGEPADLLDRDVLVGLAEACGLDGAKAADAEQNPQLQNDLQQVIRASERYGVFGVPFFVVHSEGGNAETYWGNDHIEQILWRRYGGQGLPCVVPADLSEPVR